MPTIENLAKNLTYREYQAAKELFDAAVAQSLDMSQAVGVVYLAGRLDGKNQERERQEVARQARKAHYKQQRELIESSQPEATIEGSKENV